MLCISLDSPHRSDSHEYTKYTIFNIQKENHLNYTKSATMDFGSKRFKNEFETAVVNEPSVFEPLKVTCIISSIFSDTVVLTLSFV